MPLALGSGTTVTHEFDSAVGLFIMSFLLMYFGLLPNSVNPVVVSVCLTYILCTSLIAKMGVIACTQIWVFTIALTPWFVSFFILFVPFPLCTVNYSRFGCLLEKHLPGKETPCLRKYICPTLSPPPLVEVLWCSYITSALAIPLAYLG